MPRKFDLNEMPSSLTSVSGVAGGASNRQGILQGSVNSTTGVPNFLSIGTGLAINISATATPLIVSFAAGNSNTAGAQTFIGAVTADGTSQWSGLTASTTNYLYIDRNTSTGALTYGQVTSYPVHQAFAPATNLLQNAPTATAYFGGTPSFVIDGNSSTVMTSGGGLNASSIVHVDYGQSVPITQVTALNLSFSGTSGQCRFETSPDGTTWTQYGSNFSVSSSGSTYTQSASVTARYIRLTLFTSVGTGAVTIGELGATYTYNNTNLHWFDTSSMTMKYWNGTSWTTVQRVFVGQAIAGASTITSVSSYPVGNGTGYASKSSFRAIQALSVAQSLTSATWTKVQFATVQWDNQGEYDNATNYRFTAKQSGLYMFQAGITFLSTASQSAEACFYVNGQRHSQMPTATSVGSGYWTTSGGSIVVKLNPGDYVEVYSMFSSSLSTSNSDLGLNFFSGIQVS